ncbi:hypothetical protein [Nitrosomonas halophila]|uniref:Uncharacterized protein n=1 Tax=Nitrosomonas halophila TaxID=44576 RepID=A0A1H3K2N4_9PROT|nr:hypothetical protein [Nitrosomonas halophila]SDY45774.1 hypothetical protein SAMN05421881_10371 [Nitrosomonas halophila]
MGYGDIIFSRLRKATKEEKEKKISKALRIPIRYLKELKEKEPNLLLLPSY